MSRLNLSKLALAITLAGAPLTPSAADKPADHTVVTLAEADIFAVAMTIADERASNDALITYAFGDQMPLTPVVLNGLLHIPGLSPEILFEPRCDSLFCTRASVNELIRSQAHIERSVSGTAELRNACNELEAFFRLSSEFRRPTRVKRWKNDSGQPYAGRSRSQDTHIASITCGMVNERRTYGVLSKNVSSIHEQFTARLIVSFLADSADTVDSAGPDEPTIKPRCLSAGEAACLALFAANGTNGGESSIPQQLTASVSVTQTTSPDAGIAKRVPVKAPRFGSLPVHQSKPPACSEARLGLVLASHLSERNRCITPALAPTTLTARYHVPP